MIKSFLNKINYSVMAIAMTLFFSCQNNLKEIQKLTNSEFIPTGIADDILLKYTDSGKIKSILKSPKMLDYSTVKYPFSEFPKGVDIVLYDDQNQKNYIKANYAISYKNSGIIDLKGNVRMTSNNGHLLETQQMYYDQKNAWFFTKEKFKFTAPNEGFTTGEGIDFSKDFKIIKYRNVYGAVNKNE
jgi:LPS export ABC transporter protein LptC